VGQIFTVLQALFSDVGFLTFCIILLALLVNAVVRVTERRPMRHIPALDRIPRLLGASIESSRPLHVSLGSATVGDETTLLALLGSEFIYEITRDVAVGDAAPIFTVSEGAVLPLAVDTLRRAYEHENRSAAFNSFLPLSVLPMSNRWYPAGRRSLAFAAALMTMQADDQLSGNVLVGRYGLELGLILDAAHRRDVPTIATSDQLDGQAIAYALADEALIGEEVFAVASYANDDPNLQRRTFAIDLMRGLVVMTIIVLVLYNLTAGG